MARTIIVKYGIGYGEHQIDIEVEDDASSAEIEEMASDAVNEKLWFSVHDERGDASKS